MIYAYIIILVLILLGIIKCFSKSFLNYTDGFSVFMGLFLCIAFAGVSISMGELIDGKNSIHIYQVRELEKNTVFNIKDSVGGFNPGDTVWINYSKMMIDPLDSVAMSAVIIKELK